MIYYNLILEKSLEEGYAIQVFKRKRRLIRLIDVSKKKKATSRTYRNIL